MGLGDQETALQLPDIKVHVSQVKVSGLVRTENDIIVEQIKDVLKADSLQDVIMESLVSMEKLNTLNIFKSVNLRLHANNGKHLDLSRQERGGGREGEGDVVGTEGNERGVIVTFEVKEKGRVKSSMGANVGTQSGDMNLSLNVGNVFGRAEQASIVSMTTFPHWGQSTQLQFSKPYYRNINNTFHMSLGTTLTKHPFSGFQERATGPAIGVRFPSPLGMHSLSWNGDWRNVYGFNHDVPICLRGYAGHSIKSAIKHTFELDERDDPFLPSSGFHIKMTQELAGLGGDVFFGKTDLQSAYYLPLPAGWVLSLSLWGGLLRSYSNNHLMDRFFLGGGTTLRGFGMWGAGPRENGYSKGGEAYWATGVHIYTPLPLLTNELLRRIKIHSFLTAGNLIECASFPPLRSLVRDIRLSCGVGLYVRLGLAQIELNYALPLLAGKNDKLQPGLQFGIGMDML